MKRLSWLCAVIALSACSPKGPDKSEGSSKQTLSQFEGIYLDKEEADSLRTTGRVTEKTCERGRVDGYTIGNAYIINSAGEARGYYPQWNIPEGSKAAFTINPDHTVTYHHDAANEMPENLVIRARVTAQDLVIYASFEGKEFTMPYARSNKEEVLKYFDYQEKNCRKKAN